jgi:dTDP-4-amino-4,6-dideoxygalactose transaminase
VNSRLDAMQAAVLRIKLRTLDAWNERRRDIASRYNKTLVNNGYIQSPAIQPYAKHVFHLYCVESSYRDALQRYLKDLHIGCGVYYPLALHLQPAYAYLKLGRGAFPVSERLNDRILSLPMHPHMTEKDVAEVCDALARFRPAS